jgi:hypothetical protein
MVLVAPLLELAVLLLTLALATLATIIVVSLFETLIRALSAVGLGGIVTDWLRSIEQALTSGLGSIERGVDAAIGHSWHAFARMADLVWRDIKEAAHSDWAIIESLAHLIGRVTHLHAIAHGLERAWHGIEHGVNSLERWAIRQEHRIHKIEHDIAHGIGEDLLPRTKALEREVGRIDHTLIPDLTATIKAVKGDVSALRKWITANVPLVGTSVFAGAVAIALADLGLSGLRCSNFTRLLRKFGCGLGSLLDDLLGLVVAGIALEGVCEFLPLIEAAFGAIAGPLVHVLNEVPLGACETPPKDWAHLRVAAGPLPPAQTLGPLAQ